LRYHACDWGAGKLNRDGCATLLFKAAFAWLPEPGEFHGYKAAEFPFTFDFLPLTLFPTSTNAAVSTV
jgi:hypothetical protein